MTSRTFTDLSTLIKGLCGVTRFTTEETTLITAFANRRLYGAYRRSDYWPRYLVLGESRAVVDNVIPFEEGALDDIDTFLRVYDAAPYGATATQEYNFNVTSSGARVIGDTDGATAFFVDYKSVFNGPFTTASEDIPEEFFQYAAHGTYADFLRYDKQTDKASVADMEAEQFLYLELSNVMIQRTSQHAGRRITTHSSSQAR
jgi:hypothetical protein